MREYVILYAEEGCKFNYYICDKVEKDYIVNDFRINKKIVIRDEMMRNYLVLRPDNLEVAKIEAVLSNHE